MFPFRRVNTNEGGGRFSDLQKLVVWRKATIVPGVNPNIRRKDCCGAWIEYYQYGNTDSQFGWEIDHIWPVSRGGGDELVNLQPLQWENNRAKGDQSPNALYCRICAA